MRNICKIIANISPSSRSNYLPKKASEQIQHLTVSSTTATLSSAATANHHHHNATSTPTNATPATQQSASAIVPNSPVSHHHKQPKEPVGTTATPHSFNHHQHQHVGATAAQGGGAKPQNLSQRIKFLQTQLAHAPMPSITSKRRSLPSIEEAWNLPISAEMSSRQQQQSAAAQTQQQRAFKAGYQQVSLGGGPN